MNQSETGDQYFLVRSVHGYWLVYSRQAILVQQLIPSHELQVTRRITATVEEGISQIRMTNMSKCVDPSTIRVLIGGNSILNEVNFTTRSVLDEYAEANGKLDELKLKQAEMLKVTR